ncbi:MAG: hypothetical protein L6Q38_11810, partial [Nitrospira sp.]|nr:hypothetical protein [Nitrospira sp.]
MSRVLVGAFSHNGPQGESAGNNTGEVEPPPCVGTNNRIDYLMAANISFTIGVFSFLSALASICRIR